MPLRRLTISQRSYIAGFLDADGSISIGGGIDKRGRQRWQLQILFYNCNIKVLKTISAWIGEGNIRARKRASKWNTSYVLRFSSITAVELLGQIKKYLLIKKEQAEIAEKFAATFEYANYEGSSWQGGRRLSKETINIRRALKKELQSLTLKANYLGAQRVN